VESGSCGVDPCEAESELHGTVPLFSRFLSDIVKSVSKKVIFAYILHIQGSGIINTAGLKKTFGPIFKQCKTIIITA
jgi:hypothetical protein